MKLTPTLATLFFLHLTFNTFSQVSTPSFNSPYQKAIGVKLNPGAITYKTMYTSNKAIEAIGYISVDGFQITILNEKYTRFADTENLSWYIGYGGHMAIWNEEWRKSNEAHKAGIAVGIDGIIGLDYTIKNTPLNFSVDWQPSFNFVGGSYFESGWGGIGIRYTF